MRRRALLDLFPWPALCALVVSACAAPGAPPSASASSPPDAATAAPVAPAVRREERTFTANGVALWYEVRGEKGGTPLIAVNGGPGFDHTYMLASDVWDTLSRRRPVVLYDQRGTGRSEPYSPARPHSLADHVADLEALRADLGAEKVDFVGHSWGGYLGLAYAIQHPRRTDHLVLCNSAAPRWNDTLFLFEALYPDAMERHARLEALRTGGDQAAGQAAIRELLGTLFVSPAKKEEFLKKNEGIRFNHAMNQALESTIANHDMWPAVRELTVKTLVLAGRFDANVGPQTAWKIHKAIAGSRAHIFEQSGHFPFVEEPERFVEVVEAFLDGR